MRAIGSYILRSHRRATFSRPLIYAHSLTVLLAVVALLLPALSASAQANETTVGGRTGTAGAWFAKYSDIDGESRDANHDKWIDVLSIDWGAHRPGGEATGQSRRRGSTVVEDLTITFEYEKAAPKLVERALAGAHIPKLELELTTSFGGARATYLRYELTNVMITSYQVNGAAGDGPPTVVVSNNFEEIKVTYTEYGDDGGSTGDTETEWSVRRGGR